MVRGNLRQGLWIGLNDKDIEGQFRWIDGVTTSDYVQFWGAGEPNNVGNEDCAFLDNRNVFVDDYCGRPKEGFLCNVADNVPVNCVTTDWPVWGGCSETCGGGEQTRFKTIVVSPENGGTDCGNLEETQVCNENPCPIDCVTTVWSEWNSCSEMCGGGTQQRTPVEQTPAQYGGTCVLQESRACNEEPCPVCVYNYDLWGALSLTNYGNCDNNYPCHQVIDRIYKVNGNCYKAITNCWGCLANPGAYPNALEEVTCNPCSGDCYVFDYNALGAKSLTNYGNCPNNYPCNQVIDRIYKVNGNCYRAITHCWGCLGNPGAYSNALEPLNSCDICEEECKIYDYNELGTFSLIDYGKCANNIPCNQVIDRIYKVNGNCYKAITHCSGCLANPGAYSNALEPLNSCPICPGSSAKISAFNEMTEEYHANNDTVTIKVSFTVVMTIGVLVVCLLFVNIMMVYESCMKNKNKENETVNYGNDHCL
eukprot:435281_1